MVLEACGVEKWFYRGKGSSNRFFAVRMADLKLEPGRVTGLTGRSGSGKTTLMNMLAGLLTPDGGRVLLDEKDLYAQDDPSLSALRNRHFGMIPQGGELFPHLTVMENILLPRGILKSKKESGRQEEEYVKELMEQMDILPLSSVPAGELSGGERRRVCIARALAGKPEFIFADEPTSDLDDGNTRMTLTILRQAADSGAAVMIVTHDSEVAEYADTMLRMDGGIIRGTD